MSRLSVKMKMSGEPFLIDTDSEVIIIQTIPRRVPEIGSWAANISPITTCGQRLLIMDWVFLVVNVDQNMLVKNFIVLSIFG